MKEIFASSSAGIGGLIFFFIFFVIVVLWVLRPGAKQKYNEDAQIPLKEKHDER
jgi:cbb3-type cytochrome oxidase subunit 3